MTLRAWARGVVVGGGVVAAALVVAAPAWAHSQLVSMSPADGSTVAVAPTRVVLTFDENIQDIGDAVVVTGPDGTRMDDGAPLILDAEATEQLHPLVYRGHYSVSYRIVSADGHPVSRTLGFVLTVGKEWSSPVASTPSDHVVPTSGGAVWPAVLLSAVALITAVVGVVGFRRRAGQPARR